VLPEPTRKGGIPMTGVLLLNATYEPLRVIPLKRAVVLIIQDKAEVVSAGEEPVRSAYMSMQIPTVVRLKYFVRIPYRAKVALNRRSLMARDNSTCQYCGKYGNTIDHIVPRAKGGKHEWTNVTTACSPCNQRKGDKTLNELGWTLLSKPEVPRVNSSLLVGIGQMDPDWEPHLQLT
jgi:5-methylcytosine-specific restriction endonuclease McrA